MGRAVTALLLSFLPLIVGLPLAFFGMVEGFVSAVVRDPAEEISCAELAGGREPTRANIVLTGYAVRWAGVTLKEYQDDKGNVRYTTLVPLGPAPKPGGKPADPKAAACCVLMTLPEHPDRAEIERVVGREKLAGVLTNRGGFWDTDSNGLIVRFNPGLDPARCWELVKDRHVLPLELAQFMVIGGVGCVSLAIITAFASRGYPHTAAGPDPLLVMMIMAPVLGLLFCLARGFHFVRPRAPVVAPVALLLLPGLILLGVGLVKWQAAGPLSPGTSTFQHGVAGACLMFSFPLTLLGLGYALRAAGAGR